MLEVYNTAKKKMKKMEFRLVKEPFDRSDEIHNYLGFETIEIIEFNYDGKGTALILEDGEIGYISKKELRFLFFSGWYKLMR